ncbi:GumC family protein [Chamaesiphon sp.]|uniref:GumC family protein n=1 Tax=Chamaesiphon sp. TaxID=2814140 RepID=UPI0035946BD3
MARNIIKSAREDANYDRLFDSSEVPMAERSITAFAVADEDSGYGQLWAVLLRRKLWVLASWLGTVGVAWFIGSHQEPTYRSSMQLLVEQNYRGKSEPGATNTQFADSDVQADYATQLTLMNSSISIQRIVDRLRPIYPEIDSEKIKKSLTVTQVTGKTAEKKVDTKIVEAAYEDSNPLRAQKILQTVQQVYQDYNREQQQIRLAKGLAFINEQVPQIQQRLQQAESALEKFRKTYNFLNPELQSKTLVESLDNIMREQRTNLVQIQDLSTRYATLEQKLALSPQASSEVTRLSQSTRYQNILNEIQKTELALVQERLRFTENAASVQKLNEQRQQLQAQLEIEKQRILPNDGSGGNYGTDPLLKSGQLGTTDLSLTSQFVDVQVTLKATRARAQTLAQIERRYKQEIQQFPALLSEYNRLQPAVQVNRDTLQQLLKSRQDLGLEIARGGFDWQVVEKPRLGLKTGPYLKRTLLLGAVVGLFLGGIVAFVREWLDDSIHSVDELKKQTHLPVIGNVPKISPPGSQLGIVLPLLQLSPATISTLQVVQSLPFRESLDLAYQNIQLLESAQSLKSLAITSALTGEGKSTLALGLALSAARLHQRVLLIDADLRRPSLHKQLDLFNTVGLSTLLSDDTETSSYNAIRPLATNGNLDVLTAGPTPLDPAQLLSSRRMAELMAEFEADYDLVLLDTAPILGIVDTVMVASFCGGVVIVERIGRSNRKDLSQGMFIMQRFNVVGLILNGVPHSENRYTSDRKEIEERRVIP